MADLPSKQYYKEDEVSGPVSEDRRRLTVLGISIGVHLLFLGVSVFWGIPRGTLEVKNAHQMFNVKPVELPKPREPRREVIQGYARTLQFQDPTAVPLSTPELQSPSEDKVESPAGKPDAPPAELSNPAQVRPANEPTSREKVIVVRRKVDSLPALPDGPESPGSFESQDAMEVPEPFLERMFAFTPQSATSAPVKAFPSGVKERGFMGKGKFGSLDEFMVFRIATWRDPADGAGYYEITIRPGKDAAKLAHMPKELFFLIDSSLSIRGYRMDEFKKGIVYALNNLNPGDRVNLMSFKDTVRLFAEEPRLQDAGLIGEAIRFLNDLEASERTDIYSALTEVIRRKSAILPSYVVFLSDGRPTEGITSSTRVIEEVSRLNAKKRSIFAFSGGKRVNRYLLDFLAYQNRGWSEYAPNGLKIREKIQEFYDKIRDPLLMNLRFQLSQLNEIEAFPKHLPDFFRNAEFVVYGRFDAEKAFSMRILGDIRGETKEIIFAGDLMKADAGTRDIAVAWAFNKIYYLISRMAEEGPSEAIKSQIQELSRRFGIKTPYDLSD